MSGGWRWRRRGGRRCRPEHRCGRWCRARPSMKTSREAERAGHAAHVWRARAKTTAVQFGIGPTRCRGGIPRTTASRWSSGMPHRYRRRRCGMVSPRCLVPTSTPPERYSQRIGKKVLQDAAQQRRSERTTALTGGTSATAPSVPPPAGNPSAATRTAPQAGRRRCRVAPDGHRAWRCRAACAAGPPSSPAERSTCRTSFLPSSLVCTSASAETERWASVQRLQHVVAGGGEEAGLGQVRLFGVFLGGAEIDVGLFQPTQRRGQFLGARTHSIFQRNRGLEQEKACPCWSIDRSTRLTAPR